MSPSLNLFSKVANPSHPASGLSQLPVLAVSPPSRPHTPHGPHPPLQAPRIGGDPPPSSQLQSQPPPLSPPSSLANTPDQTPHSRPSTPPPRAHHQRARSYSVKNGLLAPEIRPAPGPSWKSNSTWGDGESFTSDDGEWCESPTSTSFGENSSASVSSILGEKGKESEKLSTSGDHTVYHIYHSGPLHTHFSIHLAPDSTSKPHKPPKKNGKNGKDGKDATTTASSPRLPYMIPGGGENGRQLTSSWQETNLDPRVPIYFLHGPRLNNHFPGMTLRWGGDGRDYLREKYIPPWKQAEKEKKKGKEKGGKSKRKTQKRDMKYAPVVCHIQGDPFWRKWDLEFTVLVPHPEDPVLKKPTGRMGNWGLWGYSKTLQGLGKEMVFKGKHTKDKSNWIYRGLNEPGVVDGRGLVSMWYPFKRGPFAWRARGETGKEWVEREVARRRAQKEKRGGAVMRRKSTSDITAAEKEGEGEMVEQEQDEEDDHSVLLPPEKIPRHLWPIQLNPVPSPTSISTPSPQPTTTEQKDPLKGPPNPSKLTLVWSRILSREYAFTYLSTPFYWRGTRELNHYLDSDFNDPAADVTMKKRAVEEARKKKGVDMCVWAHLKLVVVVPRRVVEAWEDRGLGLGLLGQKRRMRGYGMEAEGLGFGDSTGEGAEGELANVKRRNSSFSTLWSGITRRSTFTNTETSPDHEPSAAKRSEEGEDGSQTPMPIQKRPIFTIFTPSRSTTPTTNPADTTTPSARTPPTTPSRSSTLTSPQSSPFSSQRPSTPTRASTWGTSTSTLVPWLSRSSTFGPSKPQRGEKLGEWSGNETEENEDKEPVVEVVLARYSCVLSHRKAGRLIVDEDALAMVAGYVYSDDKVRYIKPLTINASPSLEEEKETETSTSQSANQTSFPEEEEELVSNPTPTPTPKPPWTSFHPSPTDTQESPSTQKERLRHIAVCTCLCMVIAEKEKRDTIKEIIVAALTEGGGSA